MSCGMGGLRSLWGVVHRVRVRFAGKEFTVSVAFSDALKVGFNLLGRAGFFSRFILSFNDRTKTLTVTHPMVHSGRHGRS